MILVAFAGLALLIGLTLLLVRRDWRRSPELSPISVVLAWFVYAAHAALVVWAAIAGGWQLADPGPASYLIGTALIAVGTAMIIAGVGAFGSLQRTQGTQADRLVTSGIYRYSRHPQNVGGGIAYLGIAVAAVSGLALMFAVFYWLAMLPYMNIEEDVVESAFGDEYRRYRAKTPLLIGSPHGSSDR